MADETKPLATINATALPDGNVTLKIGSNGTNLSATLPPDGVEGVVRILLSAAYGAAFFSGKKPVVKQTTTGELIPTTFISLAALPQGQRALLIQTGGSVIGYSIHSRGLREISQLMKAASWDDQAPGALRELFARFFADCRSDLRRLGGVVSARLKASSRRRATSFSVWLSGRSLRVFRTIRVTPGSAQTTRYRAVGRCIYCGSTVYSTRPGDRTSPLGLEHIIAEGLGGDVELPESSCKDCEHATGAVTENDVVGRTMKALRVYLNLRKRKAGAHPQTLPLDATIDGKDGRINLPIADYPIIFMMLVYPPPKFVADATSGGKIVVGATAAIVQYDAAMLFAKYKITGATTAYWDNVMLCRMLAKIGHSLAAAELTVNAFAAGHIDLIRFGNVASMNMIGGAPAYAKSRHSTALHELALGYQRHKGKDYVVASIRLFADRGGPTYHVVVGESLESPIARFRRVLSNKISSMLAR
jgi:hypothetical protein